MINHKVLLIDDDQDRRYRIFESLNKAGFTDVDAREHIHQDEFEEGEYGLFLIHLSNDPEGAQVEKGTWKTNGGKVFLFSGFISEGYVDYSINDEVFYYASPTNLENHGRLKKILSGILDL